MHDEEREIVLDYIKSIECNKDKSRDQINTEFNEAFKRYNQGCRTIEELYNVKVDLNKYYPKERYDLDKYLSPDLDVKKFVKYIHDQGITQIILTNNNENVAKHWLNKLELYEYFEDNIVGLQSMYP
mmetsp:Transcript_37938/g.32093  ORF Transcript_37938/g.32093 Transcript_37938/m.32093 type:complete len:127 (-) Transcript_37938:277-657(-)